MQNFHLNQMELTHELCEEIISQSFQIYQNTHIAQFFCLLTSLLNWYIKVLKLDLTTKLLIFQCKTASSDIVSVRLIAKYLMFT